MQHTGYRAVPLPTFCYERGRCYTGVALGPLVGRTKRATAEESEGPRELFDPAHGLWNVCEELWSAVYRTAFRVG